MQLMKATEASGTIRLLGDRVGVVLDSRIEERGGILLAKRYDEASMFGTVRAVGPDCEELKAGDRVALQKSAGMKIVSCGEEYVLLREGQILAKGV